MIEYKWILFDKVNGSQQVLPPERKNVLCQMKSSHSCFPDPIVLGYLRFAAGDDECPQFITHGAEGHGEVYRWCDCLPDDFKRPLDLVKSDSPIERFLK